MSDDQADDGVLTRSRHLKRKATYPPPTYDLPSKRRLLNPKIANAQNKAWTLKNQIESPLLRLPAEVRTKIYEYALALHDCEVQIHLLYEDRSWYTAIWDGRYFRRYDLSLLQTCRQIYHEARFLPFSLNMFCFTSPGAMRSFIHDLHPAQLRAIKHLKLDLLLSSHDDVKDWRSSCTVPIVTALNGVQHLQVHLNFGFPDIRSHIAPQNVQLNSFLFVELYRFQRLPLRSCTVHVSDTAAFSLPLTFDELRSYAGDFAKEHGFRWTKEQMKEIEQCVSTRLLTPWNARARELETTTLVVMRKHRHADFWNLGGREMRPAT